MSSARDWFANLDPAEKRRALAAMREYAGATNAEVGTLVGLAAGRVSALVTDPDGRKARARRERYAGRCPVCASPKSDPGSIHCHDCYLGIHPESRRLRSVTICGDRHCRKPKAPASHMCEEHRAPGSPVGRARAAYEAELHH